MRTSVHAFRVATQRSPITRTLSECFDIFARVHSAMVTTDRLARASVECIQDSHEDGVGYLELRTTPRVLHDAQGLLQQATCGQADGPCMLLSEGAWLDGQQASTSVDAGVMYHVVPLSRLASTDPHVAWAVERWDGPLGVYVTTVARAVMQACRQVDTTVRLLLSLNRTSSAAMAEKIVALALVWRLVRWSTGRPDGDGPEGMDHRLVVGLDVSGDPSKGSLDHLWPLLDRARAAGLAITIHAGEVVRPQEVADVLAWRPDRLGHMCVVEDSVLGELTRQARDQSARPIPVELCPTSNAFTLGLRTPQEDDVEVTAGGNGDRHVLHAHPTLLPLLKAGYPLAVCTDDCGVFNTCLSRELEEVRRAAGWRVDDSDPQVQGQDRTALARLVLAGFTYSFTRAEPKVRARLMRRALDSIRDVLGVELDVPVGADA